MAKIKAILLKPLNGEPIGSEAEFDKVDFDRLKAQNAVKAATKKPKKKAARKPRNKAAPKPQNKSNS